MDFKPHIEKFAHRLAEVEAALSDPNVFDNQQKAQDLGKEYSRLKDLVAMGAAWEKNLADIAENEEILKSEPPDSELALMAKDIIWIYSRTPCLRNRIQLFYAKKLQ